MKMENSDGTPVNENPQREEEVMVNRIELYRIDGNKLISVLLCGVLHRYSGTFSINIVKKKKKKEEETTERDECVFEMKKQNHTEYLITWCVIALCVGEYNCVGEWFPFIV